MLAPRSILFLFMLITFTCCKKEKCATSEITNDYLVFGSFYGECFGEQCIEIYKLDNHHLYEDTRDMYPGSTQPYQGSYQKLHDSLYSQVQHITMKVPAQLLQETGSVIGQPDAGDWGGYYLETKQNGQVRFWLIDTKKENLPSYLHPFVDELAVKLVILNK